MDLDEFRGFITSKQLCFFGWQMVQSMPPAMVGCMAQAGQEHRFEVNEDPAASVLLSSIRLAKHRRGTAVQDVVRG